MGNRVALFREGLLAKEPVPDDTEMGLTVATGAENML